MQRILKPEINQIIKSHLMNIHNISNESLEQFNLSDVINDSQVPVNGARASYTMNLIARYQQLHYFYESNGELIGGITFETDSSDSISKKTFIASIFCLNPVYKKQLITSSIGLGYPIPCFETWIEFIEQVKFLEKQGEFNEIKKELLGNIKYILKPIYCVSNRYSKYRISGIDRMFMIKLTLSDPYDINLITSDNLKIDINYYNSTYIM